AVGGSREPRRRRAPVAALHSPSGDGRSSGRPRERGGRGQRPSTTGRQAPSATNAGCAGRSSPSLIKRGLIPALTPADCDCGDMSNSLTMRSGLLTGPVGEILQVNRGDNDVRGGNGPAQGGRHPAGRAEGRGRRGCDSGGRRRGDACARRRRGCPRPGKEPLRRRPRNRHLLAALFQADRRPEEQQRLLPGGGGARRRRDADFLRRQRAVAAAARPGGHLHHGRTRQRQALLLRLRLRLHAQHRRPAIAGRAGERHFPHPLLHVDHYADLPYMLPFTATTGLRFKPLRVTGPSGRTPELGVRAMVENMKKMLKWHLEEFETCPVGDGFEVEVTEFDFRKENDVCYDKDGVTIRHWPRSHGKDGASAYRLDWNGLSFVWTGDGRPDELTLKYAKGVDVFVTEAQNDLGKLISLKMGLPVELYNYVIDT